MQNSLEEKRITNDGLVLYRSKYDDLIPSRKPKPRKKDDFWEEFLNQVLFKI